MKKATIVAQQQGRPVAAEQDIAAAYGQLEAQLQKYLAPAGLGLVRRAYATARECHRGQTRKGGGPYILHPLEVASILAGYKLDAPTIASAVLHDVVEDCGVSLQELQEWFGREVAVLVDGVTKLTAISSRRDRDAPAPRSKKQARAENLRKIFLAMARDLRVILIKLADRLHNLRTLEPLPPPRREAIAHETLEIFAPIASRLGVWDFKWELEDLSFRYLDPEAYRDLAREVEEIRRPRQEALPHLVEELEAKLGSLRIPARIEWRTKHLYSIYQKLQRTGGPLEEVYDLVAVRVIVDDEEQCYRVLGAVHALWIPLSDRIKDYIARPKSNNYRSLHTTVYGPGEEPVEIQIRTWEMHRVNEVGIAAHWAYKEGSESSGEVALFQEVYPWIRAILDWQNNSRDAQEFVENLKLDLLHDQVFVFTPRGDVLDLPAGSTPIDFAYRIHTEVGHACVGARVNGRMVSLDYPLKNADIVEILTSKSGTPSRDWLRIVKSRQARNKIRAWFKRERRDENIARGREILKKELERHRLDWVLSDEEKMEQAAERLNYKTVDDLVAAVGFGETTFPQVLARLRDLLPQDKAQEILPVRRPSRKVRVGETVKVRDMSNVLTRLSRCCSPVPGDPIRGYISLGKGVSVHRSDCPNLAHLTASAPEREIEVEWDAPLDQPMYAVELEVDAMDRPGLVGDILGVINDSHIPARSCKAWARKDRRAVVKLAVDIVHRKQLQELMRKLRKVRSVIDVTRLTHTSRS